MDGNGAEKVAWSFLERHNMPRPKRVKKKEGGGEGSKGRRDVPYLKVRAIGRKARVNRSSSTRNASIWGVQANRRSGEGANGRLPYGEIAGGDYRGKFRGKSS